MKGLNVIVILMFIPNTFSSILKGLPTIQSLAYNTTTGVMTCILTGGPVTNLTWNRSGVSYRVK